jgi:hypothetical protein
MPILQSRMLSIIQAAEHYQDKYHGLQRYLINLAHWVNTGKMTGEQALNDLAIQLRSMATNYNEHDKVLHEERVRYNMTASRNVIERRRLARKRGQEQSPDALTPQERIQVAAQRRREALTNIKPMTYAEKARAAAEASSTGDFELDTHNPILPPAQDYTQADPNDLAYKAYKEEQAKQPKQSKQQGEDK